MSLWSNPGKAPHPPRAASPIKNSLVFSLDYFSQRNTSIPSEENLSQPLVSSGLSYYSKKNFDVSCQGAIGFNSDTSYNETAYELGFNGGYTFDFNPYLKLRPSYSHWFYSKNSHTFQSIFSDMFQLDLYVQDKWYYGGVFTSYIFGLENTFMAQIKNGIAFYLDEVFRPQTLLGVGLETNITISDKDFYNEILYYDWNTDEFVYWITDYYALSLDQSASLYQQIAESGLEPVKDMVLNRLKASNPGLFKPSYTLSYLDIGLPLSYTTRSWNLYLLPMIMIPLSSSIFYEQDLQFIFSAGIGVKIM